MLKSKFYKSDLEMVHIRKIIGFLGVGSVALFNLILPHYVKIDTSSFYTQLAVGITLIGFGIAYWTFRPEIERITTRIAKEEKRDKLDNHKQHILSVLQNQFYVYYTEWEYSLGVLRGQIDPSTSPMYPYCLSHLKSYPDLLDSFEKARKFSEDTIQQITDKIAEAIKLVEDAIKSFNDLPESPTYLSYKPHFMKDRLIATLLKNIAASITNNSNVRPFKVQQVSGLQFYVLTDDSGECAVGDNENSVKKLLDMVKPLESDKKLRSLIQEIEDLKKSLRQPKVWADFNQKRIKLVQNLTLGQRDLQGKCDYCP